MVLQDAGFHIFKIPAIFVIAVKKLIYILAVFFYLITTSGVIVNMHYCMGNYQSFDVYSGHQDECGKCGMSLETPNGCCKNELKIVKLVVDQSTSTVSFSIDKMEASAVVASGFVVANTIPNLHISESTEYAPPEPSGPDVYIRNRVFRI